jgi:hypothetical protein
MSDRVEQARQDLATANRILAHEGVIDAFGHVSMRHPTHPDRYLISRHRACELVQAEDILELTLDSVPVAPTSFRLYGEFRWGPSGREGHADSARRSGHDPHERPTLRRGDRSGQERQIRTRLADPRGARVVGGDG